MASHAPERLPSPSPSQLPPVPGSPTYSYASTAHPAAYNLPPPPPPPPPHAVLTKQDLAQSRQAYTDLISSAKIYRKALANLATAASSFGSALESCARLKEAGAEKAGTIPVGTGITTSFSTSPSGSVTADSLLAAAGLHHLVSNHQQILSETVYRSFEVPLLHDLDKWQHATTSENESYALEVKNASRSINKVEKEGAKLQKAKRRDVGRFRAHLVELTSKLDGLTQLNVTHAMTLLRESQDTSTKITEAACSLVRAEVDIFESLARKGWTGGGLEDVLEKGVDLFATEDVVTTSVGIGMMGGGGDGLFSILPPKSILVDPDASPERNGTMALQRPIAHQRADSVLSDPTLPPPSNNNDNESIFSETRSRHHTRRPFSPQPIRRVPTDVTYDSLRVGLGLDEPSGSTSHQAKLGREEEQRPGQILHAESEYLAEDKPLLSPEEETLASEEGGRRGKEEEVVAVVPDKTPYSLSHSEVGHQAWLDEGAGKGIGGEESPAVDSQSDGKQSSMDKWTTVRHGDGD